MSKNINYYLIVFGTILLYCCLNRNLISKGSHSNDTKIGSQITIILTVDEE